MAANANLLEIAGFDHKLKLAGCDDELIGALTTSIKKIGSTIQQHRQDVEAFISAVCDAGSFGLSLGFCENRALYNRVWGLGV